MSGDYEVVIIGGGPAALSAAIYAARGELRTLALERGVLGGQVALTDVIDNYPGFPKGVSGAELVERMAGQARRFGAEIRTEEVTSLEVKGDMKVSVTRNGRYESAVVILAMGADPRHLNVPGEEELRGRGVSYCGTCDAPFFREKRVVVVGGGDTALKEALFIARFASEVIIVHRRQGLRAERIYQTEARKNPKVSFELDAVVERIVGEDKVKGAEVRNVKTDEKKVIDCEGVFVFIGNEPNTGFLCDVFGTECGEHISTDKDMMTSVRGIFAIGDVRRGSYRQVATAVGEGATAGMAAEHFISDMRAS